MRSLVKSINRKALTFMTTILLYYFITRLYGISGHMNEYFDYDEGTYLMIARLINQGYLPYRDIFAVHPPLFYYMLALWLRIFGDNYVVGRLLSVFLGFLSLIVAYYVGREVKDWKLGVAFAGLLAMDPLLIHVNPLVFHESSIEFFTLLSLYYFVKYAKTKNLKYAYISLFWAGIGSTSKFTILPFAIALYLTIFFSLNQEIFEYLKNASKVILNKKQVFIGLMSYILITLISMSAIFLWPTELVRKLMIVPGLHKIEVYGQIIPSAFLLAIWGILTVYVFKISYTDKLIRLVVFSIKNMKSAILLALAFLLPKFIIEGTLGIMISRDYIHQTYLAQGGRGFPIINLFMYVGDKFGHIYDNTLELLMANVSLMLLTIAILLVLILKLNSKPNPLRQQLKVLFIVSFFVYFFVSPTLPNDRFLLPMWFVLYLILLDFLSSVNFNKKQISTMLSIGIIVLLITGYGIVYQYPQGKLKFIWAIHSKEMRDELKEYILKNNLSDEKFYGVNPMNTYYLNLQTEPYYIDTFGLLLLRDMKGSQILMNLSKLGINYYIFSTWSYFHWISPKLKSQLENMSLTAITQYKLIYADSYKNGEILEMYSISNDSRRLSLNSYKGCLKLWDIPITIAFIYVVKGNISYNYRTKIHLLDKGEYEVIQYSENGSWVNFNVEVHNNSIIFKFNKEVNLNLKFIKDITMFSESKFITTNKTVSSKRLDIYLSGTHLVIGGNLKVFIEGDKKLSIFGREIKITKEA